IDRKVDQRRVRRDRPERVAGSLAPGRGSGAGLRQPEHRPVVIDRVGEGDVGRLATGRASGGGSSVIVVGVVNSRRRHKMTLHDTYAKPQQGQSRSLTNHETGGLSPRQADQFEVEIRSLTMRNSVAESEYLRPFPTPRPRARRCTRSSFGSSVIFRWSDKTAARS